MRTTLFSLLCCLAVATAFADTGDFYTVEVSIVQKGKECKTSKVEAPNVSLANSSVMFPLELPSSRIFVLSVFLDRPKEGEAPAGVHVEMQNVSPLTSAGGDQTAHQITVYSGLLPYKPKQAITFLENSEYSLSILVKNSADK